MNFETWKKTSNEIKKSEIQLNNTNGNIQNLEARNDLNILEIYFQTTQIFKMFLLIY